MTRASFERALSFGVAAALSRVEHVDLLPLARRARIPGRLKAAEVHVGFREGPPRESRVYLLWGAWASRGDHGALGDLLAYNRDDLLGTEALYKRLLALGAVAPRLG